MALACAWALALIAALAPGDLVPRHASLIINGSGAWSVDGSAPVGWEAFGCAPLRVSGAGPALEVTPQNRLPGVLETGYLTQGFPVVLGALYEAACEARVEASAGDTHLLISWCTENHSWIGNTDDGWRLTGTTDWTVLKVADIAPTGARYGRLGLRCDSQTGTARFRRAAVRVASPREWVEIPLAADDNGRSARFLPTEAQTQDEWYAGPAAADDPGLPGPTRDRPQASDGASRFVWDPAEPVPYVWKRFPFTYDVAPDAGALTCAPVRAFLVATRWLPPLWFRDAAVEDFGSVEGLLAAVDAARDGLGDNPDADFLSYLAAVWRAPDPTTLRQPAHDLEISYPDIDIRTDQLLWLQDEAERVAAARVLAASLAAADALVASEAPVDRRRGWLDRCRLHREAGDYAALAEDAARCAAEYQDGMVPGLVRVYQAECALYDGRFDEACSIAGTALAETRGYAPELRRVAWLADVAEGASGGPAPSFLGDEEDADGLWPGVRGSAGACLIGPRSDHAELAWFREAHGELRVSTGFPGIAQRTECRGFPSDLRHAPYQPNYECRSDSFWDDRGEIWGRAVDGPNLVALFPVPAGLHKVSLLTGGYAAELRLPEVRAPLAVAPAVEGDPRLYREFLVVGPASYQIRLVRGARLMTYLSGLFLDACGPPVEGRLTSDEAAIAAGRKACAKWASWLSSPPVAATERLTWLVRQPGGPPPEDLSAVSAQVLVGGRDGEGTSAVFRSADDARVRHALASTLAGEGDRLRELDWVRIMGICRHLSEALDAPCVERVLRAWTDAHGEAGVADLSRIAEEAGSFATIMSALRIRCERGVASTGERERLAGWRDQWCRTADATAVRQRG